MIAPVAQLPPVEPQRPLTMTAAAADAVDALQPQTPQRGRRRPPRDPDTMDTTDSMDMAPLPEPHSEPSASSASAAPLTPLPSNARFYDSGTGGNAGPSTPINPRGEDTSRAPPVRSPPMPFPFPQERRSGPYTSFQEELPTSENTAVYYIDLGYQDRPDPPEASTLIFRATEAEAEFSTTEKSFFVAKAKRPTDEIDVRKLPPELQQRFTKPGGSREKEWKKVNIEGATRVHRGAEA